MKIGLYLTILAVEGKLEHILPPYNNIRGYIKKIYMYNKT